MAASKTTVENLKEAFAGESQANRKYLAYALQAEKDGRPVIARLFRAAAEAETVHALGHLRSLDGVQDTVRNLEDAVAGETYEYTTMYPPMVEQAQKESHKGKAMLGWANRVEKVHAQLFTQALEAARAGKDLPETYFWYCSVCGHIEAAAEPPTKCPVCNSPAGKFVKL
jgi:rubrerythrin